MLQRCDITKHCAQRFLAMPLFAYACIYYYIYGQPFCTMPVECTTQNAGLSQSHDFISLS